MKELRNYMITDPTKRYERIGQVIDSVFSQAKAKQLYHCQVLDP